MSQSEIIDLDQSFFQKNDILMKARDVVRENEDRLDKASIADLIYELVKNFIQYSRKYVNITISGNMLTIENDLPEFWFHDLLGISHDADITQFDAKIYQKIEDLLTTFKFKRDSNFCEGLLLVCKVSAKLTVADRYFRENRKGDGSKYFQFIKNASHIIKGKEIIPLTNIPISKKLYWKWEIESQEAVDQIKKLMNDEFIISSDLDIQLNRETWESAGRMFNMAEFEQEYLFGNTYFKWKVASENEDEIVKIYYRLPDANGKARGYHRIDSTQLNNKGVNGIVILTATSQFANVNRKELYDFTRSQLESKINTLVNGDKTKRELKQLIDSHYTDIRDSQALFVSQVLKVSQSAFLSAFYTQDKSKEERLTDATDFVYTLKNLCKAGNISYPYVKMFEHPSVERSEYEEESFQEVCNTMNANITNIFANVMLGNLFQKGDFNGMVRVKDIWNKIYYITDVAEIQKLHKIEKAKLVLYPLNPYFKYLIPVDKLEKIDNSDYDQYDEEKDVFELPQMDLQKLMKYGVGQLPQAVLDKERERVAKEEAEKQEKLRKIKEEEEKRKQEQEAQFIPTIKPQQIGDAKEVNMRITETNDSQPESQPQQSSPQPSQSQPQPQSQPSNDQPQWVQGGVQGIQQPISSQPPSFDTNTNYDDNDNNSDDYNEVEEDKVAEEVEYKGKVYLLKYVKYQRGGNEGEYPIFELQGQKNGFIKGTLAKYEAWRDTLRIVMEEASKRSILPSMSVVPLLYHERSRTYAFCTTNRFIPLNTEWWFAGNKASMADWLIFLACHELAHTIFMLHGEHHEVLMEQLLEMCITEKRMAEINGKPKEVYIRQVIRDLL